MLRHNKTTLLILLLALTQTLGNFTTPEVPPRGRRVKGEEVTLAIILPVNPRFQFSTPRILPAIDVTISRLSRKGIFPKDMIRVEYADSQCSSQYAPIEAFNFMTRAQRIHAFLGPVCDFALAPVARYAAVWNVPVLSPGGLAHDFGMDKNLTTEFQSLTRNGPTFNSVALFINGILEFYKWNKLHILYEVGGFPDIVDRFCYLAASALVYWSKHRTGNPFTFSLIYPEKGDFPKTLKKEVGLETGAGAEMTLSVSVAPLKT